MMSVVTFIRLSLFQHLLKKNLSFIYEDNKVIFHLLSQNKKNLMQIVVEVSMNAIVSFSCYLPVLPEYIEKKTLLFIINILKKMNFNISLIEQEVNLICLQASKNLFDWVKGNSLYLNEKELWEDHLQRQWKEMSTISEFLYVNYPKSDFFKSEDIDEETFRIFIEGSFMPYMESLKKDEEKRKEENEKIDISAEIKSWTLDKLNEEIDKELDKFKITKDSEMLKLYTNELNIRKK